MNSSTFKRSRQPISEISIEYLIGINGRKGIKSGNSTRKTSRPSQGNIAHCYLPKTAKKGRNNQTKGSSNKDAKSKKESQESPYEFDSYEAISNSEIYQSLSKQYSLMKT